MMLSENEEKNIGRQIDERCASIRKSICSYGMAAQFHIEKAERVLLGEISFLSDSINEGGEISAEYLKTLPDLISQTSDCDAGCAELWLQKPQNQQTSEYLYQSDRLINLLSQFYFNDYFYEKLARISEKTMLVKAHNLLGSKDNKKRVYQLENQIRMMLDEF